MEKNNIPHNTKLWVSLDSPHLGANIPIAAQENLYFFGYKGRKDDAKVKFDENFRSPAARQMLIEQLDNIHETAPYPTTLWGNNLPSGQNNNTAFRQQFQNNLNLNGIASSNGYPQNLRKIAIINGTTTGTSTNSAGQRFLELAAFTIFKYGQIFGTPIQTKIKVATIEDNFLSNTGSYGQTFSGKVTIKRVGGIEVQSGTVNRTNNNPRGTMDIVQGGTYNTQGIIKDEFTLVLNSEVDSQEWRKYVPHHAFIPSVSSLAFKNPNFNWENSINRNLVCDPNNKEIHFDSYFAPSNNEKHVLVTAESANWLLKELTDNPQAPHFPLTTNDLSGPATVCTTATFSFGDICKVPSNATWTKSSNLQITSSNGFSITVNRSGTNNGPGFVKATFQNGMSVTKNFWVGVPNFNSLQPVGNVDGYNPLEPNISFGTNGEGCNAIRYNAIFNAPSILEYEWEKFTTDVAWSVNNAGNIHISPQCNKNFSFRVRARNICGWSAWQEFEFPLTRCTIACDVPADPSIVGANFLLSPNPVTSNILTISVKPDAPWYVILPDPNDPTNPSTGTGGNQLPNLIRVNVSISNNLGVVLMQFTNLTVHSNPAAIDISNLPSGSYYVLFEHLGQIESYTIIKY